MSEAHQMFMDFIRDEWRQKWAKATEIPVNLICPDFYSKYVEYCERADFDQVLSKRGFFLAFRKLFPMLT